MIIGQFLFWPKKEFDIILAKFWLKLFWPYWSPTFDKKEKEDVS